MLAQFRQLSQTFGRTLLGMLLFVWLSMALSPCVMASSTQIDAGTSDTATMASLHASMEDCQYCPDSSMNTSLCQSLHNLSSDSLTVSMDPIDTRSFILFEIPVILTMMHFSEMNRFFKLQTISDNQIISPLALTGILRI